MAIATTLYFDTLNCGVCNINFALERSHLASLQSNGKEFYCPNGHKISYCDNENTKLRAEKLRLESSLEWERQRREALRAERDEALKDVSHQKGQATRFRNDRDRIKQRIANGVCPCCNRHFVNVERHMNTKHPAYKVPGDE